MYIKNTARRQSVGLVGREYQAPPKPRILRAGVKTSVGDLRGARGIGRAEAEEYDLRDDDGLYAYEGVIDEEANRALAETRDGHQVARSNVERAGEDARQQQMDAEAKLVQLMDEDAADAAKEKELEHVKGLGLVAYVFVVLLAY